jgi:hypothetical protein
MLSPPATISLDAWSVISLGDVSRSIPRIVLSANISWLEHTICREPVPVPLYYSRQDEPREDCDSSDGEDYEGHIGTW